MPLLGVLRALLDAGHQVSVATHPGFHSALASLDNGLEEQIVLVDLYAAATSLAALTGAITTDDVFTAVFFVIAAGLIVFLPDRSGQQLEA